MTMQITMKQTRLGESGTLLNAGSSYTVSDAFGASMVGAGFATDPAGALSPGRTVPVMGQYNPLTGRKVIQSGGIELISEPVIAPTPPNSLFRFDGNVAKGTGYTVTHTGTGGTDAIDAATSPFSGTMAGSSLKVVPASTRTEVALSGLNIKNFDGHVLINIFVESHLQTVQVQPFLGTTGYAKICQSTHSMQTGTGAAPHNGFHSVPVGPLSNLDVNGASGIWTSGINSTFLFGVDTLNEVKLRITGGGTGAVWIHSIVIAATDSPQMIFTHDDANVGWIANALPILKETAITACFGVNSGDIGANHNFFMDVPDFQVLADAGHEIYGHCVANTPLSVPYDAAASDTYAAAYKSGLNAVQGMVGGKVSSLYHPFVQGASSQESINRLKSYGVRMARKATPSRHNIFASAQSGGVFDQIFSLRCVGLSTGDGAQSIATVDQIFADCKRYGTTVIWMIHEVTEAGSVGIETSKAMYGYVLRKAAGEAGIRKMTPKLLYSALVNERML